MKVVPKAVRMVDQTAESKAVQTVALKVALTAVLMVGQLVVWMAD